MFLTFYMRSSRPNGPWAAATVELSLLSTRVQLSASDAGIFFQAAKSPEALQKEEANTIGMYQQKPLRMMVNEVILDF
jgi:hypothetical protein